MGFVLLLLLELVQNHQGLDIAPTVEAYRTSGGDRDLPIIATRDGTVVMATESISGYGKYIKIQHDNGMYSGYGHIKTILVTNGQAVKQGDIIAYMGNEGRSTGKHLHFEIFTDSSTRVDPLSYVNQLSQDLFHLQVNLLLVVKTNNQFV